MKQYPDQLGSYRTMLSRTRPVDAETERQLAMAWRKGDAEAGRKLIEASLPFVVKVAREYRRWGVPLEDLVQQGNLGLLKAASKYETDKSCRLITYAAYWIRAEIRDYVVRTYRIVRLGTTRTERRAMRSYRRQGFKNAEELAEHSGMPLARARQLWPLLQGRDASLDAAPEGRSPASERLRAVNPSPEEAWEQKCRVGGVREVLKGEVHGMSTREKRILNARLMSDRPVTLERLGKEMGVSKERVRQIEERLRDKLRVSLDAYAPTAA